MNENEIKVKMAERAAKAGFTLIEIIIAIAIVGIMAAVAVPNIRKHIANAQIQAARQLISTADQATETSKLSKNGRVPESQEKWVEALTGGEEPEIKGGEDALNDPWGTPLRYEKVGKGSKFIITSAGPDGEFDTEDDLTNEEKKKK